MMKRNYKIGFFCFVTTLFWFSLYTYVPILSPYAESLNASKKMIGLIVGSYGFTQMLLRIPLGILSDTLKKRRLFTTMGLILAVISGLGVWIFRSSFSLLIFRGISGFAAATWVIFTVLFTSYFDEKEAPKAIGIINSFNALGQMTAMLIGGAVAQYFGRPNTFLLAAAAGITGMLFSFSLIENNDLGKRPMKLSEIPDVGRDKNLLLVSFLAILSQILVYATVFGFTPIIAQNMGASSFQLGMLSTLSTLPVIFVSSLSGTFFIRRFGARNTVTMGFIISALACACIPFVGNIYVLYATQIIGGFGRGIVFPLLMGLSIKNVEVHKRATAMGFFQAIYGVGMFMGPVMVGFIGDTTGLTLGFILTAMIGAAGAAVSRLFLKENN
jgi:MFS family permease